ncbi:MAG: NUDIX domain-containing protein [Niameybacter sp.]|uniref:NUDIX hydrolase n=1 Tax=Niameybacter sp. TaxID=2033640 RepID=UPI002FC97CFE
MEKWDLYNVDRQPLNQTHNRLEAMAKGTYHIVVSIWTVNSQNQVLATLRHPKKDKYPNFWENTAGSVLAGETSRQGARRELLEETGINVEEEALQFLDTIKELTAFVDLYIVRKDVAIEELVMQEGETVDAKWVSLEQLDEMIDKGFIAEPVAQRLVPVRKAIEQLMYGE